IVGSPLLHQSCHAAGRVETGVSGNTAQSPRPLGGRCLALLAISGCAQLRQLSINELLGDEPRAVSLEQLLDLKVFACHDVMSPCGLKYFQDSSTPAPRL